MLQLEDWVRALAAILLLAGVAELLLPGGALKGYARGFLGLLVLLGVLQPAVALLRGQVRLDLPALPALAGAPAADGASAAEGAAAQAYEQLVAALAARIAQQVPGVQAASATLRFSAAGGTAPAVVGAALTVTPSAAGLAQGVGLEGQVQQAVAAGLGLAPGGVSVGLW